MDVVHDERVEFLGVLLRGAAKDVAVRLPLAVRAFRMNEMDVLLRDVRSGPATSTLTRKRTMNVLAARDLNDPWLSQWNKLAKHLVRSWGFSKFSSGFKGTLYASFQAPVHTSRAKPGVANMACSELFAKQKTPGFCRPVRYLRTVSTTWAEDFLAKATELSSASASPL
jgi:hypothetical protein